MSDHDEEIPNGYMKDARGSLVPTKLVKDVDLARDKAVQAIVKSAKKTATNIVDFKQGAMADIQNFVELSGEKYGAKMGGKKGNVTLMSFDGRYKVQRSISEYIVFDERLQVAKELIDKCIHKWSQGTRKEMRVLVNDAFQVDKEGRVSTSRILGLKRLDITDEDWVKAMQAISDSMQVAGSKSYVRIYERVGESDRYEPISLDIASA